jgi:cardiolipin synthase
VVVVVLVLVCGGGGFHRAPCSSLSINGFANGSFAVWPTPILQAVFATMWPNTTGEISSRNGIPPQVTAGVQGTPIQVVNAGPDSRREAIRQSYLAMIALARHHIYLQSPFLILDTSVAEAMKTAALAGLDVRVMIAPSGAEWSPAYRAGLTYAADMARARVRVLMYLGAYFHSKTVCVDSTLCSIGSANLDIRSSSITYETNLVVYDRASPANWRPTSPLISRTAWSSRQPSTWGAGGPRGS